jgi:hypothetical protein
VTISVTTRDDRLTRRQFLRLSEELGYQAHAWRGGYLLASVEPSHAELFTGCVRLSFEPEAIGNPERRRVEITWWPARRLGKNARKREERKRLARTARMAWEEDDETAA